MKFLLFLGLLLLGFVLGYFFQITVLIIVSAISFLIGALWLRSVEGIESLMLALYIFCAVVANVAMWVTWYCVNDQTFIQEFLRCYILR